MLFEPRHVLQRDARTRSIDHPTQTYQAPTLASCRNSASEVLGWFGEKRKFDLAVSEQLIAKDYDPRKLPLQFRVRTGGETYFHSCDANFSTLPAEKTGIPDFFSNPARFSAIAAYNKWLLPWSPVTATSFEKTVDTLTSRVPSGTYSGVMSTLKKTCEVTIKRAAGKLTLVHTMTSTAKPRSRSIEVTPDLLLGAVEGPVYKDPNRVLASDAGTMGAIEFKKDSQDSHHLMFEKRTDLDGLVVRLNGSEMYCRRLVRK